MVAVAESPHLAPSSIQSGAAVVGDLAGGLGQQEALAWGGRRDASATGLLDEADVILLRFEAEEGELETVLPGAGFGMADPHVAAGLGQDRDDVVHEMDRSRFRRVGRGLGSGFGGCVEGRDQASEPSGKNRSDE
jgi:hypothetical protein